MRKILIFFTLAALGVAAHAQELDTLTVRSARETAAELRKAQKYPLNWFVGVGGGFNISTDLRQYTTQKTGEGTGISLDIYAGKWITRRFGVRVGYHGYSTSFNDINLPSIAHVIHPFCYADSDAFFRAATWLVPYVHAG